MDTYTRTQFNRGQVPAGKHAFVSECIIAGWEGFFSVDIRTADGTQIGYCRVPYRTGVYAVMEDYGVNVKIEGE